jgi:hypothetical protein
MNYPFWDVPIIGSGWVIGAIAIFHVLISHFAVGGGFYLPMAEAKALREGREDWLQVIRGHSKFFLILTGVFGAVSGVGIWFSIGLANPEADSAQDAFARGLGIRHFGVDEPGHHQRHSDFHADAWPDLARRRRHGRRVYGVLAGVLQSDLLAEPRFAHVGNDLARRHLRARHGSAD